MAITERQPGWGASVINGGEGETPFSTRLRRPAQPDNAIDDPLAGEPKWPAWKVTVVVVVFCAAFWTGIGYLALRLLG